MSRIHVEFTKIDNGDNSIIYPVDSSDFETDSFIGKVLIEPITGKYQFLQMGALQGKIIIPPQVFDFPEKEQHALIERDYSDGEYGGWTSREQNSKIVSGLTFIHISNCSQLFPFNLSHRSADRHIMDTKIFSDYSSLILIYQ